LFIFRVCSPPEPQRSSAKARYVTLTGSRQTRLLLLHSKQQPAISGVASTHFWGEGEENFEGAKIFAFRRATVWGKKILRGPKYLPLGEQQYFCLERHFSKAQND